MAITIISSPQSIMPVYNPIYLKVSSNKTAEEAFSFVFDIYVNGTFVTRDRLFPMPSTIEAVYSPAKILESYLSYDLTHNITGATASRNDFLDYSVQVGEEWIEFWNYENNSFVGTGIWYGFTRLYSSGNTHTFVAGDSIYVQQTSGYTYPGYNGIFTVLSANSTTLIIDIPYVSTPVNGGKVSFSDSRKKLSSFTPVTGYSFNGVIQYEEVPVWNPNQFSMATGNTGSFLTLQPDVARLVKRDDRGSIGMMNIQPQIAGAKYYLFIFGNPSSGLVIPVPFEISGMTSTITNNKIIEFGIYPWNLNVASQALYGVDVINSTIYEYQVILLLERDPIGDPYNFEQVSDKLLFKIDDKCSKFEGVRFMFLNSLGQFDYFNATLLSSETINISKTSFQKVLAYNYTQGDRGRTVLGIEAQQAYTVNSDWIDEETSLWLQELILSTEVYTIDNTDGSITPIVIDMSTYEIQKHINKKLFNQVFSYSKAVTKNTARN